MIKYDITETYFEWLCNIVCDRVKQRTFSRLLRYLHDKDFVYTIRNDGNRAADGINLRRRFAYDYGDPYDIDIYLNGPCSILEMMVGLAVRYEEDTMDDPKIGNRTGQWFWEMIVNLGLGSMTDNLYNEYEVDFVINRFLNRTYEPDGRGGLFTVRNCGRDMRDVEIWVQMNYYMDNLIM